MLRFICDEMERYNVFDNLMEGVQVITPDFKYLYVNKAVAVQGKSTRNELIGATMMEMYPGIENTEIFNLIKSCLKNKSSHKIENKFVYPDASEGWFELSIQPVEDGVIILSLDITKRVIVEKKMEKMNKKLEERVRERTKELSEKNYALQRALSAIEEKVRQNEILLHELHHRVNNNLQLVMSLFNLYSSKINDASVLNTLKDYQSNIRTMSLVHQNLCNPDDIDNVDIAGFISNLCDYWVKFPSEDIYLIIKKELHPIQISIDQAISFGLIVNELLNNALKHAFTNKDEGVISLYLNEKDDGEIEFTLSDNGVGIAQNKIKETNGFGFELIISLVDHMNGTFDLTNENGSSFQIRFKRQKYSQVPI